MILDGREAASAVYETLKQQISELSTPPKLTVFLV